MWADVRRCRCLPGYQGDGTTCTNEDDCDPNPCGPGTCTDLVLDFACECPDGYSGKRCQNDACEDDPCEEGFDCVRVPEGRVCQPSCAPNCDAGDPCREDVDCDGSMFCHADGVCLKSTCTGGKITKVSQLEALRYCDVITGGIVLDNSAAADLDAGTVDSFLIPPEAGLDLPYVRIISGAVETSWQPLSKAVLPRLEEAGKIQLSNLGSSLGIDFVAPQLRALTGSLWVSSAKGGKLDARRLESIGGDLRVTLSTLTELRLSELASVSGELFLAYLTLDYVDLDELDDVGGSVLLGEIDGASWGALAHLGALGTSQTVGEIGCDLCPESKRYMCSDAPACP